MGNAFFKYGKLFLSIFAILVASQKINAEDNNTNQDELLKVIDELSSRQKILWEDFRECSAGQGVDTDKLSSRADIDGDPNAQLELGLSLIECGHAQWGFQYIKKSQQQGNKDAQVYYAQAYIDG